VSLPEVLRESVRRTLEAYCAKRDPSSVRHKVRLVVDFDGPRVTIYEERPPWDGRGDAWTRGGVGRFRYSAKDETWTLYWRDRHSKWHLYEDVRPSPTIDRLLSEVDRDPTGIFWG
jgi:hypothetical protein